MSRVVVAVVIPAYRVKAHILDVLSHIGPEVDRIFVVDDCCPDESGKFVQENAHDERVIVIRNEVNQGVGGAMVRGIRAALEARDSCVRSSPVRLTTPRAIGSTPSRVCVRCRQYALSATSC
jgi:glycosyltransferase involved in cell wall biosynthesis